MVNLYIEQNPPDLMTLEDIVQAIAPNSLGKLPKTLGEAICFSNQNFSRILLRPAFSNIISMTKNYCSYLQNGFVTFFGSQNIQITTHTLGVYTMAAQLLQNSDQKCRWLRLIQLLNVASLQKMTPHYEWYFIESKLNPNQTKMAKNKRQRPEINQSPLLRLLLKRNRNTILTRIFIDFTT